MQQSLASCPRVIFLPLGLSLATCRYVVASFLDGVYPIPATGTLQFVPAMEYPERPTAAAWNMDGADGMQMPESASLSSELLLPDKTAAAAAAGQGQAATTVEDGHDSAAAVEGGDGRLSAPIVYASLVLGMIVVFKNAGAGKVSSAGQGGVLADEGHGGAAGQAPIGGLTTSTEGDGAENVAVWNERVSLRTGCMQVCMCVCVYFVCVCVRARAYVRT